MTDAGRARTQPRLRGFVKNFGLSVCVGVGRLTRRSGIPVLGYHSVDETGSYISIAPRMLTEQMSWLKRAGYRGVSLRAFVDMLQSEEGVPRNTVVLTFDDGLRNFLDAACPILCSHGFSATNFVPVEFVGGTASWYSEYGLAPEPTMSWDHMREALTHGMDIQSHGLSHRRLGQIDDSEFDREACESKDRLEQELGKTIDLFCYPFGENDSRFADAVGRAGYEAATTVEQGLYRHGDDLLRIKRQNLDYITIAECTTARLSIEACVHGTYAGYVRTRRAIQCCLPGNSSVGLP